jgi:uncharacterized OsmC-like protein/TusA-related sulfurtransferase
MADRLPEPDAVCDGGDLDCGSGLLLIIREAMAPVAGGGVLEVRSREGSVREDLPAWCRLVGHQYLGHRPGDAGADRHAIRKAGGADAKLDGDLEQARAFAWKARVRWTGGMKAKAYVRNHAFEVGQPASFDTADPHPGAVEHLLAALGACLAVGLQWRASRRGIEVRQLEVTLQARSDNILVFLGLAEDGHPGLRAIEGRLFVDADADEATLRALWDETVRRSPVAQSLAREVPVRIEPRLA